MSLLIQLANVTVVIVCMSECVCYHTICYMLHLYVVKKGIELLMAILRCALCGVYVKMLC